MGSVQENDRSYNHFIHILQADMGQVLGLKKQKVLGLGGFGQVILAKSKEDESTKVAIKRFMVTLTGDYEFDWSVQKEKEEMFLNEVKIMSKLDSPFVMQLAFAVVCPRYFAIVMPFCEGGSLFDRVPSLTVDESKKFSKQTAQAVVYLHSKLIYHSDIKTDNVFIFKDQAVLSDFGLSGIMENGKTKIFNDCGTKRYRAPESYGVRPICPFRADAFSLGITTWSIMTKTDPLPFKAFRAEMRMMKENNTLPPGYWEIITSLTQLRPHMRPSVADILPSL